MNEGEFWAIYLAGGLSAAGLTLLAHWLPLEKMGVHLPLLGKYILGTAILLSAFLVATWMADWGELRLVGREWWLVMAVVAAITGVTTVLCHITEAYIETHHRAESAEDKAAMFKGELVDGK